MAPASTNRGAHAREVPRAGGEQREVEAAQVCFVVQRLHDGRASSSRPAERSVANGTISRAGNCALAQQLEHRRADDAGGADDGDPQPAAHRASCPIGRSRWTSARLSWNARVSACTASGTASERITHEILIGEVEIISMLISSSASVSNTCAATPG